MVGDHGGGEGGGVANREPASYIHMYVCMYVYVYIHFLCVDVGVVQGSRTGILHYFKVHLEIRVYGSGFRGSHG